MHKRSAGKKESQMDGFDYINIAAGTMKKAYETQRDTFEAVSESAARQTEITTAKSFFFTLFPLFDFVLIETVYHILHKKSTENCTK